MSGESAMKSQSVDGEASLPSSTPELESLQSAHTDTNSNPDSEPDVVLIDDDKNKKDDRSRSDVWNHFDRKKIDGVMKAVCKYCSKPLVGDSGSGTSHLRKHFQNKHHNKTVGGNIRQKLLLSNLNKNNPELASYSFNHDASKKELAKAIIMHEYPLSIVEHIGFRRYSASLQPLFKVPCRNTIKNEILQIYEFQKVKTLSLLESNVSRVAITTDMWTASNQKKGYMAVTAHFIDDTLKFFYKATEIFSGTRYPTANQCFINICEIRLAIEQWRKSSNFVIQTMAEKMLIKFEKYWNVMHGVVGVAAVLDPRYKLEVLEFYFDKIFGEYSSMKVEEVRTLCYNLLKEYHQKLEKDNEGIGESHSTGPVSNFEGVSQYELFISNKKRKKVDFIKSELDHYLEEDVLAKTDGFDVLTWWKVNAPKYPTLQHIARDFLAIPASTVASESAFSTGGRVVSPHRNRLHPNTIEALMCAQNWLWAAELNGEASSGYATIYKDLELEDLCITREV